MDSIEKYYYCRLLRDEPNNNNDGSWFGNNGVMNRGRARGNNNNNNNNTNRGFIPIMIKYKFYFINI